ncbi:viral cathepsin [Spodoptera frugiperda multiple nucleopolyhedrovirus]|uniref:Viral cathepsin n=2 Tax=Spodoptera frugiperda nuclear polyhedrosis virus TaxID=10455 RepID=A1YJ10_NPVSF|nr:viral cathepsin [Spodoptera frugiperda multiple nucleopolyhedrovirus]ABM45731.1 viral cathepsin [Spodoptera frugiperda multiple nucleopolyhedrovirus]ADV91251.1 V-CATH [Spodoptera frugiperda multiple nucleopolyhedrovirus]AFH58958.1 v-cath [Spodoptera frugiperda multiple nucleopolyhedrovirus]QED39933.1 cathepsin [Spodoptera frugiperda multiple nucleopolyhedrovirus]QED40076.1 cathepsin [Spodoptera frugiperda multiple nucleopolyhedrovirus]
MNKLLILLLLLNAALTRQDNHANHNNNNKPMLYNINSAPLYFEKFIAQYNKQYKSEDEKKYRYNIFRHNIESINQKNSRNDSAVYKINRFADMTKNEIVIRHTGLASGELGANFCETVVVDGPAQRQRPANFDWRTLNKVTSVKDQGMCGACWAFAGLGALESQYAIKYDRLIDLAEQQLVDCDFVDMGCDGGLIHTAYEQIMRMGGVEQEFDYPYKAERQPCALKPHKFAAGVRNCYRYVLMNEERLEDLLRYVGPIAIAVDAVDLTDYYGGIVSFCKNNGLNHAVLLVGYGVENNVPYWIIKNSWGSDYGEDGYVRVRRGVNSCGMINELASSAQVI